MKRSTLILAVAVSFAFSAPAFDHRSHPRPAGGMSSGHGNGSGSNMSESHENGAATHTDMSHASPSTVLSHNTAIADKIKTLTGEDAATACTGFKNMGPCVAAAHVAKNLNIPGGFDALKAKITGTGGMKPGQDIEKLSP